MSCIFCKIINKEISTNAVFENDYVVAFKDAHPKAPVHVLIVPKKHIESVNHLTEDNSGTIAKVILAAPKVAEIMEVKDGYKLAINVGRKGGQVVDHLHVHLLGWPSSASAFAKASVDKKATEDKPSGQNSEAGRKEVAMV